MDEDLKTLGVSAKERNKILEETGDQSHENQVKIADAINSQAAIKELRQFGNFLQITLENSFTDFAQNTSLIADVQEEGSKRLRKALENIIGLSTQEIARELTDNLAALGIETTTITETLRATAELELGTQRQILELTRRGIQIQQQAQRD